jgi:hypothetical protein
MGGTGSVPGECEKYMQNMSKNNLKLETTRHS